MKQRAILYTRVSTDDQNNGYSPTDQRERLLKYCDDREIDIVSIHHDDESAKTFNRHEWIKTVSYTHLDVYKRQAYKHTNGNLFTFSNYGRQGKIAEYITKSLLNGFYFEYRAIRP